jgi:hypothetical protein
VLTGTKAYGAVEIATYKIRKKHSHTNGHTTLNVKIIYLMVNEQMNNKNSIQHQKALQRTKFHVRIILVGCLCGLISHSNLHGGASNLLHGPVYTIIDNLVVLSTRRMSENVEMGFTLCMCSHFVMHLCLWATKRILYIYELDGWMAGWEYVRTHSMDALTSVHQCRIMPGANEAAASGPAIEGAPQGVSEK